MGRFVEFWKARGKWGKVGIVLAGLVVLGWITSLGDDADTTATTVQPVAQTAPTITTTTEAVTTTTGEVTTTTEEPTTTTAAPTTTTVAPTTTTAKPTTTLPPKPAITMSQENALRSALQYLDYSGFSRKGLIEQLEFEGYSNADANYAASHANVDWNQQAARSAKQYLDMMAFSRSGLIEQLMFEGYTREQAEYGVGQTGL